MEEIKAGRYTLEFYFKENDTKFSFRVKDNEQATQWLLNNCKTKRIRPDKIRYAIRGLRDKLKNYKK